MDDLIKLLQELMSKKPRPKGGIADTAEGVEFLGKTLSKEQRGNFMIVNSRLTDASRFEPFSIGNVGRDKRFKLISDYEQNLTDEFNRTVEFLKANPDIRLSQSQKDNIFYNLGVYRRITSEKNKLEKGIIEDGKKPSNVLDMEGNVLDPNEPIMGGTQEGVNKVEKIIEKNQNYKLNLFKNLDDKKKLNDDEYEEFLEEIGGEDRLEAYDFDGTAGSAKKILKDDVEYEQSMFSQYKKEKASQKGQFTKAEYLIQRLRNTIKENPDDAYVQENFPNFIKELEANPDLAKNENVFRELGGDLPSDQKITVYDDDTLDFARLKPTKSFRLNADKFKEDFNVSDEELQKILALSPEEQQKILQDYINKDFRQRIELSDFDIKDKEPNAQGGRVGFKRGTPSAQMGIKSLTPHQEYYNDKIIRDNMDFIREDMRLYFDEDNRTAYEKFIESITDEDLYGIYDERKGYDSVFQKNFTTEDGRDIPIPYKPDEGIDIGGLLEIFDKSDKGVRSGDVKKDQFKEFEV